MVNELVETTIDGLIADYGGEIKTGPFGTKLKANQYTETGVPLISVREIAVGRIVLHKDTPCVDETITSEMPEYVLRKGDIVFGRKGAVERNAIVTAEQDGWFLGSDGIRLRLPKTCVPRFIAYQLMSRSTQAWLLQHAGGTTMPSLNQKIVGRIPIVLMSVAEQENIVDVLGSLDDKIETNRRMNAVLEGMARAIFKAWFIDFEPVRAKAAGATHFPGMPQDVFDALPKQLVDSQIGEIPDGWAACALDEFIEVNPRRSLKKGDVTSYLPMANMPTKSHVPETWEQRAFGSGVRFRNGDTLVARITPCLENGKTAFVDFLSDGEIGWGSTEYIVLRSIPPTPETYSYFLARSSDFREFAISNMTGTSGRQRVSPRSLSHFTCVRPDVKTLSAFEEIVEPMIHCISAMHIESRVLAKVRDTLLPKLISGELRVPMAEGITNG